MSTTVDGMEGEEENIDTKRLDARKRHLKQILICMWSTCADLQLALCSAACTLRAYDLVRRSPDLSGNRFDRWKNPFQSLSIARRMNDRAWHCAPAGSVFSISWKEMHEGRDMHIALELNWFESVFLQSVLSYHAIEPHRSNGVHLSTSLAMWKEQYLLMNFSWLLTLRSFVALYCRHAFDKPADLRTDTYAPAHTMYWSLAFSLSIWSTPNALAFHQVNKTNKVVSFISGRWKQRTRTKKRKKKERQTWSLIPCWCEHWTHMRFARVSAGLCRCVWWDICELWVYS